MMPLHMLATNKAHIKKVGNGPSFKHSNTCKGHHEYSVVLDTLIFYCSQSQLYKTSTSLHGQNFHGRISLSLSNGSADYFSFNLHPQIK